MAPSSYQNQGKNGAAEVAAAHGVTGLTGRRPRWALKPPGPPAGRRRHHYGKSYTLPCQTADIRVKPG